MTFNENDIATDMMNFLNQEASPVTYFADVAQDLSQVATELDMARSPLAAEVDNILAGIVQVVEEG